MTIYLHYLDRELRNSVQCGLSDANLDHVTVTMALFTAEPLCCGLSLICETCYPNLNLYKTVRLLIQQKQLTAISHCVTVEEFLESRTSLYAHDMDRYPMYFDSVAKDSLQTCDTPIILKTHDTTTVLDRSLRKRAGMRIEGAFCDTADPMHSDNIRSTIIRGLDHLSGKAVTFPAFVRYIDDSSVLRGNIRRVISEEYTIHYRGILNGDIITGIPGLEYYDKLSLHFPHYDYALTAGLMNMLFAESKEIYRDRNVIERLISLRGTEHHRLFCEEARLFLNTILFQGGYSRTQELSLARQLFFDEMQHVKLGEQIGFSCSNDPFVSAYFALRTYMDKRRRNESSFERAYRMAEKKVNTPKTRVLLCTATDLEDDILARIAKQRHCDMKAETGDNGTYIALGQLADCDVKCARSQKGSSGPSGSELTTSDAIDDLRPDYVISCGIAFGRWPEKQKLGDVLVSEHIRQYEKQRVEPDSKIIPRGDRIPASPRLLQSVNVARLLCEGITIRQGIIMSGEKLVDDRVFKEKLWTIEPEAIGGEMEGTGVSSACYRRSIPWIVIKAICDWGENKESKHQTEAATNAIGFVFEMILKGSLA